MNSIINLFIWKPGLPSVYYMSLSKTPSSNRLDHSIPFSELNLPISILMRIKFPLNSLLLQWLAMYRFPQP